MSSRNLPDHIVAAASSLVAELRTFAASHANGSLAEAEAATLTAVRAALPDLLAAVLAETQQLRQLLPVRCPSCQHAARVRDWRRRQVMTSCGRLRWERPWAICDRCGQGFGAGDAALELVPSQQRSPGLETLLVSLGGMTSFREAAAVLVATTGLVVSAETIRSATEAAGTRLAEAEAAAVSQLARTELPVGGVEPVPGQLVTETDGVFVRYADGWHEVKLALVGGWPATAPARGERHLQAVSYCARRAEAATFGRYWGAEAVRRGAHTVVGWHGVHNGVARLRQVVVLGDGAHWIWDTAAEQFGERIEIVDYYHAGEHLSTLGEALAEGQPAVARAWATTQRGLLWEQGVDALLAQLKSPGNLSAAAQETLRRERTFFTTNRARMQYPAFKQLALPVGSGAIESSAKHLIQLRMKRPGCRWSDAGGAALVALRAHRATQLGKVA